MTSTGYLLVPLMLLAILSRPGWVIVALFVSAIFADASIANPGGRSIPVGWFFALLVIGRVGCEIVLGRGRLRDDVLIRMLPLALFLVSCIVSLLSALIFFEGRVIVLPGSAGLQQVLAGPFQFQPENVNQLIYLGLIFGLVYATAHLGSRLPEREIPIWIDRAMRWSCSIASAVTLWHIASFTYDVTFPADFFHSDVSSKAWDQGLLDDLRRPSGPFPEPSILGYFFSMYLFYFFQRFRIFGGVVNELFLLLVIYMLLISTSTTSYLVVCVFIVAGGLDLLFGSRPGSSRLQRLSAQRGLVLKPQQFLVLTTALLAVVLAVHFVRNNGELVTTTVTSQFDKTSSVSYELRTSVDRMAWQIFLETYGMGLGVGSHRPSSGLLAVLVGPGLPGALLLLWCMTTVLRPDRTSSDNARSKPIRWAVIGLLIAHATSSPEFQSVPLWACFAILLAMKAAKAESQRSRPTPESGALYRRSQQPSG